MAATALPRVTPRLVEELSNEALVSLNMDLRLQATMSEILGKGVKVINEFKAKQDKLNGALEDALGSYLGSQSAFHEENQRLLGAIHALVGILAPNSATTHGHWDCWQPRFGNSPGVEALGGDARAADEPFYFTITLRKADGSSLGLTISHDERNDGLSVEGVVPGGAVDAWNRQCLGGFGLCHKKVVQFGDRVVAVNGISDTELMLKECTTKRLLRITILRNGTASDTQPRPSTPQRSKEKRGGQPPVEGQMRIGAPEFVPQTAWSGDRSTSIGGSTASTTSSSRAMSPLTPPPPPQTPPPPPPPAAAKLAAAGEESKNGPAAVAIAPPPGLLQPRRLWREADDTIHEQEDAGDEEVGRGDVGALAEELWEM